MYICMCLYGFFVSSRGVVMLDCEYLCMYVCMYVCIRGEV